MSDETKDSGLDPILSNWGTLDAPDDFAARVMARVQSVSARSPTGRSRRPLWIGAVLASVASAAVLWFGLAPIDGTHLAQARQSVTIGRRGIAVLEPGADVQYRVGWTGATEITQRSGSVFYRVERGGAFVVHTAAGDVTVQGTCFRVEVRDMKAVKSGLMGASIGAALTAAVFVTVFEGKVSLANPRGSVALSPGEQATASTASAPHAVAPTKPATTPPAPTFDSLANLSPAELQKHAEEQRTEIIGLHDQVRKLRADLDSAQAALEGNRTEKSRGFELEPSKEELGEMAKSCTLKWDSPEMGTEPQQFGPKARERFKLSQPEADAINKVFSETHSEVARELRALYVEITGDRAHADSMTAASLLNEIHEKSNPVDVQLAYQRLAQERAGQAAPPVTTVGTTAIERAMRIATSLGDRTEKLIAGVVGEQRAHDMRRSNNGWGSRSVSSSGCPDSK